MRMLTPQQFLRDMRNVSNKFDAEIFRAKQEIGQRAVDHFKSSFERMGYAGAPGSKWKKRIEDYPHPIMNKTGRLMDSISFRAFNSQSSIVVMTTVPYAKYHNDDATASWSRNQNTSIPITRRQFMGNSASLEKWIQRRLQRVLIHTFR